MSKKLEFEFFNRPGLYWSEGELKEKVNLFRSVATECLDEVPEYQCLRYDRSFFKRAIIVTVKDKESRELLGFCSAVLFKMNFDENVLHLGLTCVRPSARGLKLTHKLTSRILRGYFLEISLFKTLWISNVACVLSSLGNVAKFFEDVYPSPYVSKASQDHKRIASVISSTYRKDFFVAENIYFDEENFIFEKSVCGNSFEKSKDDTRFFHRNKELNDFYLKKINFDRGDEVLQIGKVNLLTFVKYFFKQLISKFKIRKNLGKNDAIRI